MYSTYLVQYMNLGSDLFYSVKILYIFVPIYNIPDIT